MNPTSPAGVVGDIARQLGFIPSRPQNHCRRDASDGRGDFAPLLTAVTNTWADLVLVSVRSSTGTPRAVDTADAGADGIVM